MKKFNYDTFDGNEEVALSKTAFALKRCADGEFFVSNSNNNLINTLYRNVKFNHLCHSYLFLGKDDIGKFTLAVNFAAAILCKNKVDGKACYACSSCKKILSDNHPDLTVIEGTGAVNSIHIDAVRAIRQDAYLRPNESEQKVFIIKNAEQMTISAFNALLKVLEEPPKTAMFLLTSQGKNSIPATILSRCIPFSLFPFSNEECKKAISVIAKDKTQAEILSATELSNGLVGHAIKILQDENSVKKIMTDVIDGINSLDEYKMLKSIFQIKTDKALMNEFLEEMSIAMRNVMLAKVSGQAIFDLSQKNLANRLTMKKIQAIVDLLQEASEKIATNVNIALLSNWLCEKLFVIAS